MRTTNAIAALCAALVLTSAATAALADNWQATKLRGDVFVSRGDAWVRLNRGDIVADSSIIRTRENGAVEFVRDRETIDLGADTQIRIFDRTGQRFTTVQESYGAVSVEANVENVRHFSVRTPFVAALVKGTIFSVRSNAQGSIVTVQRGVVGVEDLARKLFADVRRGQQASAGRTNSLQVSGAGTPGRVTNIYGQTVGDDATTTGAPATDADADGAAAGGDGAVSGVASAVSGDASAVTGAVSGIAGAAVGAVSGVAGDAVGAASGVAGAATGAASGVAGAATGAASGVAGAAAGAVGGAVGAVGGAVGGIAGAVAGAVGKGK
jgi:hypothetical protein